MGSDDVNADDLVLQTVYVQPTDCTDPYDGPTMMAISGTDLWYHAINPATSVTYSSCYPSQFVSSALATSSLPPFKQLICPKGWESYDWNSTYRFCCPNGYSAFVPEVDTNVQRPANNGVCSFDLSFDPTSVLVSFNAAGSTSIYDATVSSDVVGGTTTFFNGVVYATLFDGTIATTTLGTASPVPKGTTRAPSIPASATGTGTRHSLFGSSDISTPASATSTHSITQAASTASAPASSSSSTTTSSVGQAALPSTSGLALLTVLLAMGKAFWW